MKEALLTLELALYMIVLIFGTICVILYTAGWDKGMKVMGIMFVCYILIKAIVGGL